MTGEERTYLGEIASGREHQLTAVLSLVRLLINERRFEEAEDRCLQVLEFQTPVYTPIALSLLGFILTEQGHKDEAVAAYREAVALLTAVRKGH